METWPPRPMARLDTGKTTIWALVLVTTHAVCRAERLTMRVWPKTARTSAQTVTGVCFPGSAGLATQTACQAA
eukprot:scaffold125585_cov45-Phaeocystis_antarctica.AAC.2